MSWNIVIAVARRPGLLVPILLALATTALAVWFLPVGQREPAYQGKELSRWLVDLDRWDGVDTNAPAVRAIRSFSTNAIPTLVRLSLWQDSAFKEKLGIALERYPRLLRYRWTIPAQRWMRADQALGLLGEPARAAIPYYLQASTNHNVVVRRCALNALSAIGPLAEETVPGLIGLQNDPEIRGNLLGALGNIGRRPDLCLPLLRLGLQDTNAYVRKTAAHALGAFGGRAKAALPSLTNALQDRYVAKEAARAIRSIHGLEEP